MISPNLPIFMPLRTPAPPQPAGDKPLPISADPPSPQDGVQVNFRPPAPAKVHGKLGETGFSSALQSLPLEGKAAQLLNAKTPPMTREQRTACIADLEVLNLTGQLQSFDPMTGEHHNATVKEAMECMLRGESIFYGQGRQGRISEIPSLPTLSAAAQQAKLGIVG